jgi:mRNA-degrading endonuclease RelE of RelBE toxin-antitoxin system
MPVFDILGSKLVEIRAGCHQIPDSCATTPAVMTMHWMHGLSIERLPAFDKAIGELQERFPHAETDILEEFKAGPPQMTDPLPAYGRKLWKARAGSKDLKRGKSGGFRIIYYWDKELPSTGF